ncbi:hypothetical protein DFR70_1079 [Nocardia tenerifensis]|uniref:Uncharacterized protein n=1 Tax=Nocardia tenerifensis TaxID=228006 RepID=A0A318KKJ6_9NOCA|nr:hypothetical protein [Nocardia tenerifensis]PXX62143.1 hypothetical protein DFR70_1079 [Nocardia tenerifensis]
MEQRTRAHRDPLAVVLGNASLLGVGYVMLGRRRLAAVTGLLTISLVVTLATVARTTWFEIVVVVWWALLVVHSWILVRARQTLGRGRVARQRVTALGVLIPVLLALGLLRFEAVHIGRDIDAARHRGDCGGAQSVLDRRWLGDTVADAPLAARGDHTERACRLLREAEQDLDGALAGDIQALSLGVDRMSTVRTGLPGHETMADHVLHRFSDRLPTADPCRTSAITDWLSQQPRAAALNHLTEIVARIAPTALVDCGDQLMTAQDWPQARSRYQQVLDGYPGHPLTERARQGVEKATRAIELAKVRDLLRTPVRGSQPRYCTEPAPYSGAAPYGPGLNHALLYGNDEIAGLFPPDWTAGDAADAAVVMCMGSTEFGAPVATCTYENKAGIPHIGESMAYTDVTFQKKAVPLRIFEVRTGRLIADTRVEIGGASCPEVLEYTFYGHHDFGPPSKVYVSSGDADVRAAFQSLITP